MIRESLIGSVSVLCDVRAVQCYHIPSNLPPLLRIPKKTVQSPFTLLVGMRILWKTCLITFLWN